MFNLSFFEIVVIGIIGLIVVGPEELPGLIKKIRRGIRALRAQFDTALKAIDADDTVGSLKKEADDVNHALHTIVDLEGKEREAYPVEDVLNDLEKYKNTHKNSTHKP